MTPTRTLVLEFSHQCVERDPLRLEKCYASGLLPLGSSPTPRTGFVNNPVNPSGAVYSAEQLSEIAAPLLQHPDIWILADGLYEHIVFDGLPAPTLAEIVPRLKS